jgi:hypothetical protein
MRCQELNVMPLEQGRMQMPKGYWMTTYRSIKDPDKLAAMPSSHRSRLRLSAQNISCVAPPPLRPKPGLSSVW